MSFLSGILAPQQQANVQPSAQSAPPENEAPAKTVAPRSGADKSADKSNQQSQNSEPSAAVVTPSEPAKSATAQAQVTAAFVQEVKTESVALPERPEADDIAAALAAAAQLGADRATLAIMASVGAPRDAEIPGLTPSDKAETAVAEIKEIGTDTPKAAEPTYA